ncbi:MAG: DUF4982 domain-containing protein [Muribaculaceae bacterium]|nr:DUF4982 domain-containing protein [Muribaculaceae bacterium]
MKLYAFLLAASCAIFMQAQQSITPLTNWQFSRDSISWENVNVPHDWAIAGPFDKKWDLQVVAIKENGENVATEHTGRSGSLPWIGKGYYKTEINYLGEDAELVFDGAMAEPKVWVNGKLAGCWAYGYNAFRVPLTPYVTRYSNMCDIVVKLENLEESSRWYPGAGLFRPVNLVTYRDKTHLEPWQTFIRTIKVKDGVAELLLTAKVNKPGTYQASVHVWQDNNMAAFADTHSITTDEDGTFEQTIKIKEPKLWSPESPYIYNLSINLSKENGTVLTSATGDHLICYDDVDKQELKFGIRTISFTRDKGFQLNDKTIKFKGVCLHHDLGPLGAAVNKAALIRQIKILKDMGANAIRTSHNMPSTLQMEICDSLGMMVMAESFDSWKDPKVKNGYNRHWNNWWKKDITNLILNHRNHPSIVMWSVGNEIPEQWKEEGAERYRQLVGLCHVLDPSRPVTCGMDQPDADIACGFTDAADVPGYNYRTHRYEATFPLLKQGFLLGSETASTVSTRGHYCFPDTVAIGKAYNDGQCSGYDLEHCWWSNLPDDDWRLQDDMPWTIGEFVWTGFDYLGEPTPYDAYWPSRSSYYGIIDLAGLPKDRFFLYRSHWNKNDHTIHLLPHWTWPDRKGKVTPVYCYTDYPSAELFVNGKSQGRITKDPSSRLDRYRLRWRDVVYEPGELKVVVYDNDGNRAGEQIVKTAGKAAKLKLDADRNNINADGNDLAFITVSLTDKNGTLCPDADDQLEFKVTGAATFKAVCNGDATSLEQFTQPTMKLFHGQLVVVVQATDKPGNATLTVTDKKTKIKNSINITVK